MGEKLPLATRHDGEGLSCPSCESTDIETLFVEQEIEFGDEEGISAMLPIRRCRKCRTMFLDEVGERAKHVAICRHFGLLTPDEIRAIRESYAANRMEFARVTGLGTASLARREAGSKLQSVANDRYLRLLSRPGCYEEMLARADGHSVRDQSAGELPFETRFPSLRDLARARREQSAFRLH